MAGLLGDSMDDTRTMAVFAGIQGLLGGRGLQGVANGLLSYGSQMQEAKKQAQRDEMLKQEQAMRALTMQQHQMALEQAKKQAARQTGIEDAYRGAMRTPEQMAMAGGGGPTMENLNRAQAMAPGVDQNALIRSLQSAAPDMAYQMLQPEKPDYKVVGNSLVQIGKGGVKEAYRPPEKPETTNDLKEYQFAKNQGYQGSFTDYQTMLKKAGASSVSVNTGQHGFDNTLKLRTDFRSEPVYKAHQEMQSAYSQIQQALKAGTPVGDLAGATKIMKLLDPGSVVRESELGMAMASNGLLDRVTNYANMIITGQKLTPKQRQEFQSLADSLLTQSADLYNTKRGEYGQIAGRNGLNIEDVAGAVASTPGPQRKVVRTGTSNGRKVVQYSDGSVAYAD